MSGFITFLKNWTLPVSMATGAIGYLAYDAIPALNGTHAFVGSMVKIVQPTLLFAMLFLTFCKVKPSDFHFSRWQPFLLVLQTLAFALGAVLIMQLPNSHWNVVIESFMICMICPTATAAAVVTSKLGGNPGTLTTYTILINIATALLVPTLVPLINSGEMTFIESFLKILSKVFPLLFGPFVMAMLLRKINPRIVEWFNRWKNLAFYLWGVGLALAIAVTVRIIKYSDCPVVFMLGIALASALACIIQFAAGRYFGRKYGEPISGAQSCGQKNTVFAIWMGYTFLSPITSLAGGFYSVWHNVYNSYQLYQARKKAERKQKS